MNNSVQIKRRFSFYLIIAFAVIGSSSCSILKQNAVTTYNNSIRNAPFDVVIVPGLPHDTANINPLLKARMLWAKELYDKGITRHIIFSGSAVQSPYVEAVIMKLMAEAIGIPAQHTFTEVEALHSTENVAYGIALANSMGFKNIAIATDPIQALFLKKYTKENHAHVFLLPFSFNSMPVYYRTPFQQVNAENAFVENFVPLKNREPENLVMQD
ncbi:MAG: YdcF family protein [Bacteroidia bacterium]